MYAQSPIIHFSDTWVLDAALGGHYEVTSSILAANCAGGICAEVLAGEVVMAPGVRGIGGSPRQSNAPAIFTVLIVTNSD